MGAIESSEGRRLSQELKEIALLEEDFQDHQYPWFQLVQWSCEKLPPNAVYKWNYDTIRADVEALTESANVFLERCPPAEFDDFTFNDDSCFLEWSQFLLQQVPSLAMVRYELVPKLIPELSFWKRYYAAVRHSITVQISDQFRIPNNCFYGTADQWSKIGKLEESKGLELDAEADANKVSRASFRIQSDTAAALRDTFVHKYDDAASLDSVGGLENQEHWYKHDHDTISKVEDVPHEGTQWVLDADLHPFRVS